MNPFIETFTPNSSRTKFNRRKHEDSYFSRVSDNTVQWINHQSPLEQFFYFLVLIVCVLIFTAIYFIYTKHYVFHSEPLVMNSSTLTPSDFVVTATKKQMKLRVRKTTTPRPLNDEYHGHYNGHHPPVTIPKRPITEASIALSEEPSSPSTIKLTTETKFMTVQPIQLNQSAAIGTTTSPPTTKREASSSSNTKLVTDPNLVSDSISSVDVRNEFAKLIDVKIAKSKDESPFESDAQELLRLAKQMQKRNQDASSCAFIGFNHLSVPINFRDYYWYKPQTESFNATESNLWDGFDPACLNNCSGLNESIRNKLNQFWDSCMTKNQNISDLKRLIVGFGFDSVLPKNVSRSEVNSLLKSLDYRGLFNFKSISDPFNHRTVRLVERDDYPFWNVPDSRYENVALDLAHNEISHLGGSSNDSSLMLTLIEAFALSETIQNLKLNQRTSLEPKSFSQLDRRNFLIEVDENDFIELESGFVYGALRTINDYQPIDLYYYLLLNYLKKNAIHLNSELFAFYAGLTDMDTKVRSICRNLVALPFGLVLLKDHLMRTNTREDTDLVSAKLADYMINKLVNRMINKLPSDKLTSEVIHQISFVIFEQLAVDQIAFNDNHIDQLYDSLHITDNHLANVQSIRSWLQYGYDELCLLNYASFI